jgi:hypothetical protein
LERIKERLIIKRLGGTNMSTIYKACIVAIATAFVFTSVAVSAQPSLAVKEDQAQLKADKAALHRQIKRLEADEARWKADQAEGKMSAMSKDAYEVYMRKKAVMGEAKDITNDKAFSLQMKADKAALQRQIKQLEAAEARLKADKAEGKMAAESKDSLRVYEDKQAIKGEKKDIAADKANLKAAEKNEKK